MKLTYFYLKSCPHCRRANEMIAQLLEEEPAFRNIQIDKVEESEHPEIADKYDYWYVPCFFLGGQKLFEGVPSLDKIRDVLKKALDAKE